MRIHLALFSALLPVTLVVACSANPVNRTQTDGTNTDPTGQKKEPEINIGGQTAADGGTGAPVGPGGDPTNCADAALAKSYLGCDFWPTVTYNPVDATFDFAAVVSNPQTVEAVITTTGPGGYSNTINIKAGETGRVFMPWVQALKDEPRNGGSIKVAGAAYNIKSTVPVVAYQFNPLEYKAGPNSGPAGKDWTGCVDLGGSSSDCFSYSNDASLLLPATALTGNYRIYGPSGATLVSQNIFGQAAARTAAAFVAITATQPGTLVKLKLAPTANVKGGAGVSDMAGGSTTTIAMNAGDVVLLETASATDDLSGSLVTGNKPIQVLSGMACAQFPYNTVACDHVEESLFPVETLGKRYFVVPPTGPNANAPGVMVRIHGNVDNTVLTYLPSKPSGCPATVQAGQSVSCGSMATEAGVIKAPFEVSGDHEFAVSTYQLGGQLADTVSSSNKSLGDPSQSQAVAVEQYRSSYTFLTPKDYDKSFIDITSPVGTVLLLDGAAVPGTKSALSSGFELRRVAIANGSGNGSHKLTGDKPFGIQVSGYGTYTSYQYPGGLNLGVIADVPVK